MAIYSDNPAISTAPYRGRFAPSPTGPLHFGSLIAAVGSYLEARAQGGEWLLRIEDLDPPREMAGATDSILATLEAYGFEWDGPVVKQSDRLQHYRDALDRLNAKGLAYPCACTRKEIADSSIRGIDGPVYPGTCRNGLAEGREVRAWRLRTTDRVLEFIDEIQGLQCQNVYRDVGDFVLLRADGYFAYQLAVVVDDAEQGVNHVVRGADLLDSTARQVELQLALNLPSVKYAHLPIAVNEAGEKLSKQTKAPALSLIDSSRELVDALRVLGQAPEAEMARAPLGDIWIWARENWRLARVPKQRQLGSL